MAGMRRMITVARPSESVNVSNKGQRSLLSALKTRIAKGRRDGKCQSVVTVNSYNQNSVVGRHKHCYLYAVMYSVPKLSSKTTIRFDFFWNDLETNL